MKTAYAYARFSSDNQREESIDAQLRAIREYCATNDIRILREFKDEAFSARTDKRPAFQDLFGLIKEHQADYLIVHKLDRFARNRADAAFYRQKLKEVNMKLVSVLERLDDNPESIILEGMLDSLNEYYSANLSRETKKGLRENVLKGRRNGGKPPIGYDSINQHLAPNKDAEKVTEVFRMYAAGKPYREMMAYSGWPHRSIENMLCNEVYLGHLISGENRYNNAHTALVDEGTWEVCRRRMSSAAANASNRAKHDYMLARMLVCGKCGKPMHGISSNGHLYYACRTKGCRFWHKDELEKKVVAELAKHLQPTQEVKDIFYKKICERVNNLDKVEEAKRVNASLSKRIQRILNAVQYAEQEEAEYLLKQAKDLKAQMVTVPKPMEIPREACDRFIDMFADFGKMEYTAQKETLRKLVYKITVFDDYVHLSTTIHGEVYGVVLKDGIQ